MSGKVSKLITSLFYALFFLTPLAFHWRTSELFEFNKMIVVYIFATLITSLWIIKIIIEKGFIFKRTLLDIPLAVFLLSQILSTIVSIDIRTSLLGYYSRFHGGLYSSISYALLYWAFVSNMDRAKTYKVIISILISSLLVSLYAILEHFGVDKNVWIQDVQNRVFSSLGQPNWLAAYLVAILPLSWAQLFSSENFDFKKLKIPKRTLVIFISLIFFLTLIYTKSKSGIFGFAVSDTIFWLIIAFFVFRKYLKPSIVAKLFVINHLIFAVIILISGTYLVPQLTGTLNLKRHPENTDSTSAKPQGPALEVGSSDSGTIRKIVWKGAIDIWKNYPIFGSGVETFAFAYYKYRPIEHNLVSEWDFLYNKAHNEYLNFAATTGTFGLLSYLALIVFIVITFIKSFRTFDGRSRIERLESLAMLSGFSSILITNFFGFSVVAVALLFFLYPAIAVTLVEEDKIHEENKAKPQSWQKVLIVITLTLTLTFIYSISKYWYADYIYTNGKANLELGYLPAAKSYLENAVKLSPKEAIFWSELSQADAKIAIGLVQEGNNEIANQYISSSITEADRAIKLSPANVNLKRDKANDLLIMTPIKEDLLPQAGKTLEEAIVDAPTDAKLWYNLALVYVRLGNLEKGKDLLLKVIDMKANYRNAHYALGLVYNDLGQKDMAIKEYKYILEKITPEDEVVKRELQETM